jgi:geranylgeranyl reductase family protein
VRELPFAVDPVVEDRVRTLELGLRYTRRWSRRAQEPLILMTQRRRLDAFLAEQAARAGAEFRDGVKVTGVEPGGAVTIGGERLETEVVVGADGANGITARSLGLPPHEHGVALEGNVEYAHVSRERFCGRAVVELGAVPGGYAWVFPKGDHVNVGVGGWGTEGPRLRSHLQVLCEHYGIELDELTNLRGHRLPMRRPETMLSRGRALLVGDAAGVLDPVSGDGIYEAVVSGKVAAEHILAGTLEAYEPAVRARLDPLSSAGWGAKMALDRFPRAVFAIMRLPVTWRVLEKLMLGEVAHPGEARGAGRTAMKLIEGLAKAA